MNELTDMIPDKQLEGWLEEGWARIRHHNGQPILWRRAGEHVAIKWKWDPPFVDHDGEHIEGAWLEKAEIPTWVFESVFNFYIPEEIERGHRAPSENVE